MAQIAEVSPLQVAIEAVEALPAEDQEVLVNVIGRRLSEQGRARVIADVEESRAAYNSGTAKRGTIKDLLQQLEE